MYSQRLTHSYVLTVLLSIPFNELPWCFKRLWKESEATALVAAAAAVAVAAAAEPAQVTGSKKIA